MIKPTSDCLSADYMSSYEGVDYTSRPVTASTADGHSPTLGETLQRLLPQAFGSDQPRPVPSDSDVPQEQSDVQVADSQASSAETSQRHKQFFENHSVLVAGIRPPLQTPLPWLYDALHAPDRFLYVIVIATV